MSEAAAWTPFPWLLGRGTGLPLSWLTRLPGEPDSARALADGALADEAAWDAALARARAALADLAERPLFREAALVSNPALDAVYDSYLCSLRGPRDATSRKREQVLYRYAQRFCAKNDSTSFFGAVAPGRLDGPPYAGEALPIAAVRTAYLTHWAACALLERAAADLRAEGAERDRPRLAPGALTAPERVARMTLGRGARLAEEAAVEGAPASQIAALADGERDAAALVAGADLETLDALRDAGLLLSWTALPAGADDPLAWARRRLEAQAASEARDRWLARLDAAAAHCRAFAAGGLVGRRAALAALEADFEAWTGARSRRRAGSFYASRGLVHEVGDRTGGRVGLPPGAAARVRAALCAYLEVSLLAPAAERLKLRAWFDRAYGDDAGPRPWREVAPRLHDERVLRELYAPPEARELTRLAAAVRDAVRAQLDAHLADHGPDSPATIALDALTPLLEQARPLLDRSGVAYANPDVMLLAGPGGPTPLLAEAHHLPILTPALLLGLAERDAIVADTRAFLAALCAPAKPAFVSAYHHSFISAAPDLGEVALELSGLSPRPPARRASFAHLMVEAVPSGGFRFTVPSARGAPLEVAPLTRVTRLDRASPVFPVSALDLPAFLGPKWRWPSKLPRVRWGDLVVHRRMWRVASKRWVSGRTTRACAARLRQLVGPAFPRLTFVKAEGEPKPLLIDWDNPIAVELALKLARKVDALRFVEMIPGPSDLWLRGPDGLHTAELRTVFARTAGGWAPPR